VTVTGCGGAGSSHGDVSSSAYNPASGRIGALAGIPAESDVPSGGVVPNLAPAVGAGRLAAANAEASTIKAVAGAYLTDHPGAIGISSDSLQPPYVTGVLKARYQLSLPTESITRVDLLPGGWVGIVFSLSQQKWLQGVPDNNHENDQDVP
jgi:hypothetical protein